METYSKLSRHGETEKTDHLKLHLIAPSHNRNDSEPPSMDLFRGTIATQGRRTSLRITQHHALHPLPTIITVAVASSIFVRFVLKIKPAKQLQKHKSSENNNQNRNMNLNPKLA